MVREGEAGGDGPSFPRVAVFVSARLSRESLVILAALIWFFTSVNSEMNVKTLFCCESLVTLAALIWVLIYVVASSVPEALLDWLEYD